MATFTRTTPGVTQTAKGKSRLALLKKRLTALTAEISVRQAERFKQLAAAAAPSAKEEAEILSEGVVIGAVINKRRTQFSAGPMSSSGTVGTPDDGRFIRQAPMMSLRAAILKSSVRLTRRGLRVTAVTCQYPDLNAITGFSWETVTRGIQGPTLPFNRRYAQAVENGGVWEVRRRTQNLLNPDDGVYAARMIKTIPPYGMFRRAKLIAGREGALALRNGVKEILRTS